MRSWAVLALASGCFQLERPACLDTPGACMDAPGIDAREPDAPPVPGTCGGPTLLTDNFADGMLAPWVVSATAGAEAKEEMGRLRILPGAQALGAVGVDSELRYDLRGSALYLEVPTVADAVPATVFGMAMTFDGGRSASMAVVGGELDCVVAANTFATAPYAAGPHHFWRISEAAGQIACEVSPDAVSWTMLGMAPTPSDFDLGRITLGGANTAADGTTDVFEIDNVNGGGTAIGSFCRSTRLVDEFDSGAPGRLWDVFTGAGCTVAQMNSQLVITPATMTTSSCGYVSSTKYDVRGTAVQTRISQVPGGEGFVALTLDLGDYEKDSLLIGVALTQIITGGYEGGTMNVQLGDSYAPDTHVYFRIRESGGMVFFETSTDGSSWASQGQTVAPAWLDAARVRLGAGTFLSTSSGVGAFEDIRGVVP